ncbi:cytochrome b/b6 domain-containing protein [Xanthobacter autotrophicus]|uniref:cytochrome b n=1 Tax=Xanthobacter autotrophicus TaxID=280 RepID=UPI0037274D7D
MRKAPEATRPARWSGPVRLLHWTMAGLVLTLLALGFAMTQGTLDEAFDLATSFTLYQWHKWIGLLVLALWLPRLVARAATQAPAALAGWQGRAARAAHGGLYVLMLAMPVTGWLATSASPLHLPLLVPLPVLGPVALPDLIAPDARAYALLSTAHEILAFALIGLVALHVAGAARHALVDRDDTLRRMAP